MIAGHEESMTGFLTALGLKFPGLSIAAIKASAGGLGIVAGLMKSFVAMGILPVSVAGAGILALGANGKEAIANIQLPLDLSEAKDIEPYFRDIFSESELLGSAAEFFPQDKIQDSMKTMSEWCENAGEKLEEQMSKACAQITEHLPEAAKNAMILTEKEKIQHVNRPGIIHLQKSILELRTKEKGSGTT